MFAFVCQCSETVTYGLYVHYRFENAMIYASYSFDEHETLMKLFDNEAVYIDSSANFVDISKDYALKCVTY